MSDTIVLLCLTCLAGCALWGGIMGDTLLQRQHRKAMEECDVKMREATATMQRLTEISDMLSSLQVEIPTEGHTLLVSTNGDITHFIRVDLAEPYADSSDKMFLYTLNADGTEALIDRIDLPVSNDYAFEYAIDVFKSRFKRGLYTNFDTGEWCTTYRNTRP